MRNIIVYCLNRGLRPKMQHSHNSPGASVVLRNYQTASPPSFARYTQGNDRFHVCGLGWPGSNDRQHQQAWHLHHEWQWWSVVPIKLGITALNLRALTTHPTPLSHLAWLHHVFSDTKARLLYWVQVWMPFSIAYSSSFFFLVAGNDLSLRWSQSIHKVPFLPIWKMFLLLVSFGGNNCGV